MAHQTLLCAVVGQRNAAVGAAISKAALPAAYKLVGPAPVDKQNTLLTAVDVLLKLVSQKQTDVTAVSAPQLPFHIHDLDSRQLSFIVTLFQFKKAVRPVPGTIHAGDLRRSGTKKKQRA